jgi:hypothetical protein
VAYKVWAARTFASQLSVPSAARLSSVEPITDEAGDEDCPLTTASQSAIFLLLNFLPDLRAEKGADG